MRGIRAALAVVAAMAVVAAAVTVFPAFAQDSGKGKGHSGEHKDRFTRLIEHRAELGLTDDQVLRLESVRDRYVEENQALRQQIHQAVGDRKRPDESMKNLSREERHEAMKKRHEELLAEHPELVSVFDQLKSNREAIRNELDMILTAEQQDKLKQMRQERREKAGRSGREARGQGSKT